MTGQGQTGSDERQFFAVYFNRRPTGQANHYQSGLMIAVERRSVCSGVLRKTSCRVLPSAGVLMNANHSLENVTEAITTLLDYGREFRAAR
jgi:hypothetical protein